MSKLLTLVVLFVASTSFAATEKQKALRASADSVYGCSVTGKGTEGQMKVYIKDLPSSSKVEIVDVEFSNLKTGISEDDQSITEQNGILKVSSKSHPEKTIVADSNAQTLTFAGSDLSLESCKFKTKE